MTMFVSSRFATPLSLKSPTASFTSGPNANMGFRSLSEIEMARISASWKSNSVFTERSI